VFEVKVWNDSTQSQQLKMTQTSKGLQLVKRASILFRCSKKNLFGLYVLQLRLFLHYHWNIKMWETKNTSEPN